MPANTEMRYEIEAEYLEFIPGDSGEIRKDHFTKTLARDLDKENAQDLFNAFIKAVPLRVLSLIQVNENERKCIRAYGSKIDAEMDLELSDAEKKG